MKTIATVQMCLEIVFETLGRQHKVDQRYNVTLSNIFSDYENFGKDALKEREYFNSQAT